MNRQIEKAQIFQKTTIDYVSQCQLKCSSLLKQLLRILEIDEDIRKHLPKPQQPYEQYFWAYSQQYSNSPSRQLLLLKIASQLYHSSGSSLMLDQYNIFMHNSRKVPLILKAFGQFNTLKRYLEESLDIQSFRIKCNQMINQMNDYSNQKFYSVLKWKLLSCEMTIEIMTGKAIYRKDKGIDKQNNKQTLLKYVKFTKNIVKNEQVNAQNVLECYIYILNKLVEQNNKNIVYVQMEVENLLKRVKLSVDKSKYIKNILKQCQNRSKIQINQFMSSKWNSQNQPHTFDKKCSNLVLQQNHITLHQKIARSNIKLSPKTITNNLFNIQQIKNYQYMDNHKRRGLLGLRSSIARRVGDNNLSLDASQKSSLLKITKNVSAFQYTKSLYSTLQDNGHKQFVITCQILQNQLHTLPLNESEKPEISHQQILLQLNQNENISKNSLHMSSQQTSIAYSTFNGLDVNYQVIFGTQIFWIRIFQPFEQSNSLMGFQIKCMSLLKHRVIFQNGKNVVSFEELKKIICFSELYFELMKQKIEIPIEIYDVEYVQEQLNKKGTKFQYSEIMVLISVMKMMKFYIYWYYTTKININGPALGRRINTKMTDSLKFSVMLELLRKNNALVCLQHFTSSRYRKQHLQCFYYLSDGRQIIAQSIIKKQKQIRLRVYCLKPSSYASFNINPQNKSPYFAKPNFQINDFQFNGELANNIPVNISSLLTTHQTTILMLQNIIENKITKRFLMRFLKHATRSNITSYIEDKVNQNQVKISMIDKEEEQKGYSNSHVVLVAEITINSCLINFFPFIRYFAEAYNLSFNFKVNKTTQNIVFLRGTYSLQRQYYLEGKLKFIVLSSRTSGVKSSILICQNQSKVECQLLKMPFHNLISQSDRIYSMNRVNIIRKNLKQQFYRNNLEIIIKRLLKIKRNYYYCAVSWHKDLLCWRIDIYDPLHEKTFIAYLPPLSQLQIQNKIKKQYNWKIIIKYLQIDPNLNWIIIDDRKISLFQRYGSLQNGEGKAIGKISLLQNKTRLYYLVQSKNTTKQNLMIGTVDENPFSQNTNLFADYTSKYTKVSSYTHLLIRLYHRFTNENLPLQEISIHLLAQIYQS